MGVIPVSVGQQVPLSLQLEDGELSLPKVVKAVIRNNLGAIIQDEIVLTHIGGGLFKQSSFIMPSSPFITAQYTVYESNGNFISQDYSVEIETFQQSSSGSGGGDGVIFIGNEYVIEVDNNVR